MNIATILIGSAIAALLALAVRYLVKNGMCAACEDSKACHAAAQANGASGSGCKGRCSACQYYEAEQKSAAGRHAGA